MTLHVAVVMDKHSANQRWVCFVSGTREEAIGMAMRKTISTPDAPQDVVVGELTHEAVAPGGYVLRKLEAADTDSGPPA